MKDLIIEISTLEKEKLDKVIDQLIRLGLKQDKSFTPKNLKSPIKIKEKTHLYANDRLIHIIRGQANDTNIKRIEESPKVISCWVDSKYIPFSIQSRR